MEEWIARRVHDAHLLKPCEQTRKRNYLYIVTEFVQGQTLNQWMMDNPRPDLEVVRNIIEQIGVERLIVMCFGRSVHYGSARPSTIVSSVRLRAVHNAHLRPRWVRFPD